MGYVEFGREAGRQAGREAGRKREGGISIMY